MHRKSELFLYANANFSAQSVLKNFYETGKNVSQMHLNANSVKVYLE